MEAGLAERIVSLIPSATEMVCALGFGDGLVGRSHECDFPESVRGLPALTEPKFRPEGASGEVDAAVQTVLRESLSVYRVLTDRLRGAAPTVIVTQTQCEVCAVSLRDVEAAAAECLDASARIVALAPMRLSDVWEDIGRLAGALGVPERGRTLVGELRARLDAIAARARSRAERPTLATIEWIDPLMAGGNWMPELVELAGGINVFGEAGAHSPWLEWEELRAADPEVILITPCGFGIERALGDVPALTGRPGWRDLGAVRSGRVYVADGNHYFNRPGPRLVESLEILAEILHPDAFDFGHRGAGWRPLESA